MSTWQPSRMTCSGQSCTRTNPCQANVEGTRWSMMKLMVGCIFYCYVSWLLTRAVGSQVFLDCIYLFGGWNGHIDLPDLWSYSLAAAKWTCLSHDVQMEGGPAARRFSYHTTLKITLLFPFQMYDFDCYGLVILSLFSKKYFSCHRLVFDPQTQQIFCLGRFQENVGRADTLISDFYAYHIPTNTWHLVAQDTAACGGPRC